MRDRAGSRRRASFFRRDRTWGTLRRRCLSRTYRLLARKSCADEVAALSSRISRIGILSSLSASCDRPPRYTIAARQMTPRNRYSSASPPPPNFLPFGAVRPRPEQSLLFISPQLNPSNPYTGASMELLDPTYDFGSQTFEITPEEGACLSTPRRRAESDALTGQAYPRASSVRLRLALEPVKRKVERPSASSADLPGGQNDQPWDPAARVGLHREALFALFSGRLPDRPWPTAQLVGLEEVDTANLLTYRAGRTDPPRHIIKLGDGAFRGLKDWLRSPDGAELPLAEVVQPEGEASGEDDEAFVTGFRIRAKRTPKVPPTGGQARGEMSSSAGTSERWSNGTATTRRRGVGANGGIAVLWHGREQDPEENRRPITILRAGDEAEGVRLRSHTSLPRAHVHRSCRASSCDCPAHLLSPSRPLFPRPTMRARLLRRTTSSQMPSTRPARRSSRSKRPPSL